MVTWILTRLEKMWTTHPGVVFLMMVIGIAGTMLSINSFAQKDHEHTEIAQMTGRLDKLDEQMKMVHQEVEASSLESQVSFKSQEIRDLKTEIFRLKNLPSNMTNDTTNDYILLLDLDLGEAERELNQLER